MRDPFHLPNPSIHLGELVPEGTEVLLLSPDPNAGCNAEFLQQGTDFSKVRVCGVIEPRWVNNEFIKRV